MQEWDQRTERRKNERRPDPRVEDNDDLRDAISQGVADGIARCLADKQLVASFWEEGFSQITSHASTGASQWVGKRILVTAIAALFIWAMGWLIRNGAIK